MTLLERSPQEISDERATQRSVPSTAPQQTDSPAEQLVEALARYRESEQAMRRRMQDSMGMNASDMHALRVLIAARAAGRDVSPKELATELGFSSASITALLDRLERTGHLTRGPAPHDRRGLVVASTDTTDDQMRGRLGRMHARMMEVASSLDAASAEAIIDGLDRMRRAIDDATAS